VAGAGSSRRVEPRRRRSSRRKSRRRHRAFAPRKSAEKTDRARRLRGTRSFARAHLPQERSELVRGRFYRRRTGMARRNTASLAALALAALACGTEGDASSLPDKWPRAGLSGYTLFNADAPLLLSQAGVDLDEPTAMTDPEGKGIVVWG